MRRCQRRQRSLSRPLGNVLFGHFHLAGSIHAASCSEPEGDVGIPFDGLDLAFVQGFHGYDSLKEPTFLPAGDVIVAIDRVEIARFDIGPQVELLLMFIRDNLLVDDMDLDKKVEIVEIVFLNLSVGEVGVVGMSQRATGMLRALCKPCGFGEGHAKNSEI